MLSLLTRYNISNLSICGYWLNTFNVCNGVHLAYLDYCKLNTIYIVYQKVLYGHVLLYLNTIQRMYTTSNHITYYKQSYHVLKAIISRITSNNITYYKKSYHVFNIKSINESKGNSKLHIPNIALIRVDNLMCFGQYPF